MKAPALPANEAERLADLHSYGILDTPAERVFDEVAELAATICGTEFAAVTLIDRDRQWFKSEFGLGLTQTSRDESICGHAILERDVFEVPDTSQDERFIDNPLLESAPGIRFYGGSQLMSEQGNAIGMLCVMDSQPHRLSDHQRKALTQLADVLMAVIEAGRKTRLASWFGTLLDNVHDEILILDPDTLLYLHANRAAQEHLGYTLDEMRRLTPMTVTGDHDEPKFRSFVERLRAGEPSVTFEGVRCRANAQTYPVEARWQLLATGGRRVILSIVQDVTEQRGAELMKDQFIRTVSRELELARTVQRRLLPQPAQVLGMRIGWYFQSSSFVGGDSFDYLALDERYLCFFTLDVVGHGVAAAMMAMGAHHHVLHLAQRDGAALLAAGRGIGEAAVELVSEYNRYTVQLKDSELFVSLLFGIYDRRDHKVAMVQAGHPAPLVCNVAGGFEPVGSGGVPVGILQSPGYEALVVDFPPGSRLVVLSDGVIECSNSRGAVYGDERLLQFLQRTRREPVDEVARAVGAELAGWRAGEAFEDDVSLLVMEAS
jgi:PAS domain S-box-containing protein